MTELKREYVVTVSLPLDQAPKSVTVYFKGEDGIERGVKTSDIKAKEVTNKE
jgi:hypothetical protein